MGWISCSGLSSVFHVHFFDLLLKLIDIKICCVFSPKRVTENIILLFIIKSIAQAFFLNKSHITFPLYYVEINFVFLSHLLLFSLSVTTAAHLLIRLSSVSSQWSSFLCFSVCFLLLFFPFCLVSHWFVELKPWFIRWHAFSYFKVHLCFDIWHRYYEFILAEIWKYSCWKRPRL